MIDRFLSFRDATSRTLFGEPGVTTVGLRAAVAAGHPPESLAALVGKIRSGAFAVTDQDLDALRSDYGDDALFEIIVAAAYGTASDQLAAARRALEEA
jgi:hypothetical protein